MPRILIALLAMVVVSAVRADPPPGQWTLPQLIEKVPPLKHDATGRLPMIAWEAYRLAPDDRSFEAFKPLPPEQLAELKKRGLTYRFPPDVRYLDMAKALQAAGLAVIMVEGTAFNGPGGDIPANLHPLPADFPKHPDQYGQQPFYPCPMMLEGWKLAGDKMRTTLTAYRDAGVTVNAVWLDWEVEPYPLEAQWLQAKACPRCRKQFPPGVLDDRAKYNHFIIQLEENIYTAYVAAPILEIFPECSTTNWAVVNSSTQIVTRSVWANRVIPPVSTGFWTAANPVAYGNSIYVKHHWKAEWNWPLDEEHMDRLYTWAMFAQVSAHQANADLWSPWKQSIPWVARYCPDDPDPKIPILTRERYREILRHIWLRGADSMQIFNPLGFPGNREPESSLLEVVDAVAVYDEMLAHREFLDHGTVMNTAIPDHHDDGAIWSGLRVGEKAVVRAFTMGKAAAKASLTPFDGGPTVELDAPPAGATYLLQREGERVDVQRAE